MAALPAAAVRRFDALSKCPQSNRPRTGTSGSPWSPVSSGSTSLRWSSARSSREIEQLRFQIGRWGYRDLIREQIGPWMAERTVDEIVELGQLFRLPIAALGNGATIREMEYMTDRNDPCHCGSGNKYKKCCLAKDEAAERDRLVKAQVRRDQHAVAHRHDGAATDRLHVAELTAALAARLARAEEEDAYEDALDAASLAIDEAFAMPPSATVIRSPGPGLP